ncbi:MAG: hypothetical protein ACOX9C_05275 [Kiritimatiellia bacterium]|jgi:hypothetical protein
MDDDNNIKIDLDEMELDSETAAEAAAWVFGIVDIFKRSLLVNPMTYVPIILSVLLWMVTAWIPFVNIGTTIALFTLPVWLANKRKISPVEMFFSEHWAKLENFLLLSAVFAAVAIAAWSLFSGIGCFPRCCTAMSCGSVFWLRFRLLIAVAAALVPLAMVGTSWSMAYFLLIDKDLKPLDALQASADLTRGSRLKILAIFGLPAALGTLLCMIFGFIPCLRWLLVPLTFLATATVLVKLAGTAYETLQAKATEAD